MLRILYLYYRAYPCLTDIILVLQSLFLSFGTYTGNSELILVFRNLNWYFGTYTGISKLILVFRSTYLYFGFYMCITGHILILRILFLCEGTRMYDKSELIIIVSHTRSDQTYADTYQIWTLVHSRYGSQQIQIPDSYRFRTYPITNRLSVYIIIVFRVHLFKGTCRYYWTYTYITELILNLSIRKYP